MQRTNNYSPEFKGLLAFDTGLNIINQRPDKYCFNDSFELKELPCETVAAPCDVIKRINQLFDQCITSDSLREIEKQKIQSILSHIEEFSNRTEAFDPSVLQQKVITPICKHSFENDTAYNIAMPLLTQEIQDYTEKDISNGRATLLMLGDERGLINTFIISFALEQIKHFLLQDFKKLGGKLTTYANKPGYNRFSWEDISTKTPEAASIALRLQNAFSNSDMNELYNIISKISGQRDSLNEESKNILLLWQLYLVSCHLRIVIEQNANHTEKRYGSIISFATAGGDILSKELQKYLVQLPEQETSDYFKNLTNYNAALSGYLNPYYKSFIDDIYTELYKLYESLAPSSLAKILSSDEFSKSPLLRITNQDIEKFYRVKICTNFHDLISKPEDMLIHMIMIDFLGFREDGQEYTNVLRGIFAAFNPELEINLSLIKRLKQKKQSKQTINEQELCDDFIEHLTIQKENKKPVNSSPKKRRGRTRPKRHESSHAEKEKEEPKPIQRKTAVFSPIPTGTLLSTRKIICDDRIYDWFSKNPIALQTPSYKSLSKENQKKQKIFHSYPVEITKIAILRGIKGTWQSESSKKANPHYSLMGQIERYKEGKEAIYTGVFTDCFDAKNQNQLYHHHFTEHRYNTMLDNFSKDGTFQANEEIRQVRTSKKTQQREFLDDKERFLIEQRPGMVIIDDTKKKIRYTTLLSK